MTVDITEHIACIFLLGLHQQRVGFESTHRVGLDSSFEKDTAEFLSIQWSQKLIATSHWTLKREVENVNHALKC